MWKNKNPEPLNPLDRTVLNLGQDAITVRDTLRSIFISGMTGSGKTSSSGKTLMAGLARIPGSGGCIFAAKPEDVDDVRQVFRQAGRLGDLVVMSPDTGIQVNVLNLLQQIIADCREIANFYKVLMESIGHSDGGGEMAGFFEGARNVMIESSVMLVSLADGDLRPDVLRKFIEGAAQNPAQTQDEEWRMGFHNSILRKAMRNAVLPHQKVDFEVANAYFTKQLPRLSQRTRSCIESDVCNLLNVLSGSLVRFAIASGSNFQPFETLGGRWLLIDYPPTTRGMSGTLINAAMKYVMQRMILWRKFTPGDGPHYLWLDEYQQYINSFDAFYLAQSRSHGGGMVCLTQSIESLYAAMQGERGHHLVNALLGNFGTKIFHGADVATASWGQSLAGKEMRAFVGGSTASDEDWFSALFGQQKSQSSYSTHYEHVLQLADFFGLRTGGRLQDYTCDSIVIKSGEPFSDGRFHKFVSWRQR